MPAPMLIAGGMIGNTTAAAVLVASADRCQAVAVIGFRDRYRRRWARKTAAVPRRPVSVRPVLLPDPVGLLLRRRRANSRDSWLLRFEPRSDAPAAA